MGGFEGRNVVARPSGSVTAKGSVTTTSAYQTVASYTVTKDKTFHLAKIAVSCKEDVWVKVRWDGTDVSIEYLVMAKLPFTDWFPQGWHPMLGDGSKVVDIQAKYDTTADTVFCELVGEEI